MGSLPPPSRNNPLEQYAAVGRVASVKHSHRADRSRLTPCQCCQCCRCCRAQTATVYSDANGVQPKEYTFKVQHVRGKQGHEERKTVGKVKVDLSTFCTEEPSPVPQEVFLQLK